MLFDFGQFSAGLTLCGHCGLRNQGDMSSLVHVDHVHFGNFGVDELVFVLGYSYQLVEERTQSDWPMGDHVEHDWSLAFDLVLDRVHVETEKT